MATNGIEILIDVLAKEAITSTDQFIKVITDAAGKVGTLSGSIDVLDGALTGISKSGASAEEMAATLVSALEDFGIKVKDADGLAKSFADALKGLGASGKEAATGVDLAAKANENLIGPTDAATVAVERESGAFKIAAISMDEAAIAAKGYRAAQVASAGASKVAVADLGAGYARMTKLSEMATPALMKAATWAGIGLAGLAYEGIKQYTQFNKLITQTITQAGVAPSKMGFLSGLAESVAKSTGQHLNDVANTIYRAASGTAAWNNGLGATNKQLGNIVTSVSKLNVVGGIATGAESEQASRVVTALINSNIRGVGRSALKASALVNAVVGSGDMRLADLVPGIGRGLLSSAVANNVSAKDIMAWVATLTSQGTTASVAGNYVKTGVNLLAHPSAQGVAALAMLGIKPGELENLMSGPGGLVSALSTLKTGMKQLNPGNAGFFFDKLGHVRAGGSGTAAAIAKLQTWSANELNPKFIADWKSGKLTAKEQTQATDLILTKAFGGSKQFATIAAVINNLGLVRGIESHIGAENSTGYFNKQYAITAATPAQQFKRMQQSIMVDLVNIGKTLTPLGLTFGHAITGIIGVLSKFKFVLYGLVGVATSLLAFAGAAKVATIGSHLSPFIGAGYNRLGRMAGENSAFTKAMNNKANGGAFKFLNIYGSKQHGILSKLGGEAINAGANPILATEDIAGGKSLQGLSQGENALNTTMARGVTYEEQTAANTRVIAEEMAKGGLGGGGIGSGRGRGTSRYAPQFKDPITGRFLSAAESTPLAARMAQEKNAAKNAAMFYGATGKGRGVKSFKTKMFGGSGTALENVESTYATRGTMSMDSMGRSASNIASRGAAATESLAANGFSDVAKGLTSVAATGAADVGGGLMSGLGGLAGGPIGMIGMMAAPMIIAGLTPAFSKLGSLLGGWLGGGKQPVFHANINHALDSTQAAAQIAKDAKVLHQYQTQVKNKAGKKVWVENMAAYRADPMGYNKALKNYQLANHTYTGSIRNSNSISSQAISALYGRERKLLAHDAKLAKELSGHTISRYGESITMGSGTKAQMRALAMQLPGTAKNPGLKQAVLKMMSKNGANWQDFSKLIGQEKSIARGTLVDAAGSSAQWLAKHDPVYSAMSQGGYFQTGHNLSLNTTEMRRALSGKNVTAADAAKFLPQYATQFNAQFNRDKKALLDTHLKGDARANFQKQENSAKASRDAAEALIREFRKDSKNTHLAGESVGQLAKESANQIRATGLTADAIGQAVAKAISQYIKTPRPGGTSTPVTTKTRVP